MKINYAIFLITLVLLSSKSHAYDYEFKRFTVLYENNIERENDTLKKTFSSDISHFLKAFNDGNLDEFCYMIYPKLFEFQSREELIKLIKNLRANGLSINTNFVNIKRISNLITAGDEIFCKIYYHATMKVTLSGKMLESKEQIIKDMENYYGSHNIKYDDKSKVLFINASKSMFAISNGDLSLWKYLENNEIDNNSMDKLIPIQVLKQLNK